MDDPAPTSNLPAEIADAVLKIPKALVPASVKALDRLIGAAVDWPVAWFAQQKAKIDAQTEAYKLVENAIAKAAASNAGADEATVKQAVNVLVRKAYRKQVNREGVAIAMLEDLHAETTGEANANPTQPTIELDDDWLNVFERYAEDASSERMQKLWGRVLAGEVRKPGRFSMRTLRFLSEFSQADAITFADFCGSVFGDMAPVQLVRPNADSDIRTLIYLESAGLIQGSGLGLTRTIRFNAEGNGFVHEGNLALILKSSPNTSIQDNVYVLTPLGQELLALLPDRDSRAMARRVAEAMRVPQIEAAYLAIKVGDQGQLLPMEILWQTELPQPPVPTA